MLFVPRICPSWSSLRFSISPFSVILCDQNGTTAASLEIQCRKHLLYSSLLSLPGRSATSVISIWPVSPGKLYCYANTLKTQVRNLKQSLDIIFWCHPKAASELCGNVFFSRLKKQKTKENKNDYLDNTSLDKYRAQARFIKLDSSLVGWSWVQLTNQRPCLLGYSENINNERTVENILINASDCCHHATEYNISFHLPLDQPSVHNQIPAAMTKKKMELGRQRRFWDNHIAKILCLVLFSSVLLRLSAS